MWLLPMWKKFLCKKNIHCFDEVFSPYHQFGEDHSRHYLSCDACDLIVDIKKIDTTYSNPEKSSGYAQIDWTEEVQG
jgi:hypothetical protein